MALDLSNASKYKGGLKSLENIRNRQPDFLPFNNTFDVLVRAVAATIEELKQSIYNTGTDATGDLAQSILPITGEITRERVSIKVEYNEYGNKADKGSKAEGFTKEKRNKLQPSIYRWINSPGKKQSFGAFASSKKEARSLSYAIATNILKKGTKGKGWLTKVVGANNEKLDAFLSQEISKAVGRDVEVLIVNEISQWQ